MTVAAHEAYEFAREWLESENPMICGGLTFNTDPKGSTSYAYALRVLSAFQHMTGYKEEMLIRALESFSKISTDFIRLQSRFIKTGHYQAKSAADLRDSLYRNADRMKGYYLDGLLLTYVFWPNHARLLAFFEKDYLMHLPKDFSMLEIGVGHGLMAYMALSQGLKGSYLGVDISPSSLEYARALLSANEVDENSFHLEEQDAAKSYLASHKSIDAVVCCEVLEHVDKPEQIAGSIHKHLKKDGRAFVTTVANIEAEDHVYLFHDEGHIQSLLRERGLEVERELIMPLNGIKGPRPINYAAILRPVA